MQQSSTAPLGKSPANVPGARKVPRVASPKAIAPAQEKGRRLSIAVDTTGAPESGSVVTGSEPRTEISLETTSRRKSEAAEVQGHASGRPPPHPIES